MADAVWRPSQKKYGVARCCYKGSGVHTLPLYVGDTVQILEEYFSAGSESSSWYRGLSLKSKDKLVGIFPVSVICIKPCEVENSGQFETITPIEDIMVREVTHLLQEWREKWRQLFVMKKQHFEKITACVAQLISLHGLLAGRKLSQEDAFDVRKDIVSLIDWGNCQLGMDLVPRTNGEQVNPDQCSIVQLYRLHKSSAQIAETDMPSPKQRPTSKSSKSEMTLESGISCHHLLVSIKHFGCDVGDNAETLLSLYQCRDNKVVSISEKFLVYHTTQSEPNYKNKPNNHYGLFTDLTNDDIGLDIFLVAHIYRLGGIKSDNSKKSHKITFKRPWGVGVTTINVKKLPTNIRQWEFQMKVECCTDSDSEFSTLHEKLIKKVQQHVIATLTVSVQTLNGELGTVKKENPMLFNKGVVLIQTLGFSEIISTGDVRNDFYVTLKCAELHRGNKKSQKNVEVKVTVLDEAGKQIPNCIRYGCGDTAQSEYASTVFYHNNKPEWNETIKISVPIDIFPGSHILFEVFHCSVSESKKDKRELYGVAFLNVTNKDNIVLKNDVHKLCLYKLGSVDKQDFFTYPFLLEDLNNPQRMCAITKNNANKFNDKEFLTISTFLCSGKFTQNGNLLGILNWRGEKFRGTIGENLGKLFIMQGEEIVKFMHDILQALFEMLDDPGTDEYRHKIFLSLINIFTLLHCPRFGTFRPMLESYIIEVFSAPLAHKILCICFAEMIERAVDDDIDKWLIQSFQDMDYIFRFIVQSRHIQQKDVFSNVPNDDAVFRNNLQRIFQSMANLLSSKSKRLEIYQVQLLNSLHLIYVPLLVVQSITDVAEFFNICLAQMSEMSEEVIQALLSFLIKIVQTQLFESDESRGILLPILIEKIKTCFQLGVHMKLTVDLLTLMMDAIFKLRHGMSIKVDIQKIVFNMFDVVIYKILQLHGKSCSTNKGLMMSCLMDMLRLMGDDHFENLLHVCPHQNGLYTFLMDILKVFKLLVQPDTFPMDWALMKMVTNDVVFQAMAYFSCAIKENFITEDSFHVQIWSDYFLLAVAFIIQPSLQLDRYTSVKADMLRERYQDIQVSMCHQVQSLWQALGSLKEHFIPNMVGPFLELTLVPKEDVRKATLPIIYDMMEWEQKRNGSFKQVEAVLIERLDYFLTQQQNGDALYKDLFKEMLLERVQSEPNLSENGTKFIISVTSLLERLLEYRQVVEGEENKDKRMHSTFNILNFYKDEINREEMYIRYVNKLHELHMVANNHAEAGLTLQLYAKVLNWSDEELPEEMRYRKEKERDRKETLYTQIINCFDKGKVWEYALPMCKDLAEYYESQLDYKKLADILKQQASFYVKILEGVPVPSDNPTEPETHYPRQDPSYYRVAYYGKSFPSFVSNKQFIYRGDECLKLATIMNHLTSEFPSATILSNNNPQNDDLKDGEQQFIQICCVKPVPRVRPEFQDKVVPFELRNFYNFNEVDTFLFDRPYHREEKDKDNECKTLCIERTKMKSAYKFPGILRWYEVIDVEIEMLCPIRVAIETLKQYNSELTLLINRCLMNEKLYFSQLEMRLHGIISAAVGGGIAKYHEAFFTRDFEAQHYDEMMYLDQLKELLTEQIKILQRGMDVHLRMAPPNLQPLHLSLDHEFKKMKRAVSEYSTSSSSTSSLTLSTPTTPESLILVSYESKNDSPKISCSSYKDDLPGVPPQDKFDRNYVLLPEDHSDIPPLLPLRLESTTSTSITLNQAHSKDVLSGNQMTYSCNNDHTPISSSGGQRTSAKVVYKRDSIIETCPDIPPKIPAKQRPLVPNEPAYQQFRPNIKDSETSPKKADKLPISPKPSDLVNGFMRKLPGVSNNSSPSAYTKSPALTPNLNVPPLPPRKNPLKTLSNSTESPRLENPSVEIDSTMSSTDYQSPKEIQALAPGRIRKDITLTSAYSTQGHEQTPLSNDPIYKQCPPLPERIRTSSFTRDTSSTTPSLQIQKQTSSLSKDRMYRQSSPSLEQITSSPSDMSPTTATLCKGREQTLCLSKDRIGTQGPPVPERIRTSSISKDRAHITVPQPYKQPQTSSCSKDSTTEKMSTNDASKMTHIRR